MSSIGHVRAEAKGYICVPIEFHASYPINPVERHAKLAPAIMAGAGFDIQPLQLTEKPLETMHYSPARGASQPDR